MTGLIRGVDVQEREGEVEDQTTLLGGVQTTGVQVRFLELNAKDCQNASATS